jgi:predicted transcriptional regulator
VIVNQLKRQGDEINKLGESLETKKASQSKLERQVREAQRKYADLETRMKEDLMMARIRDAENTQCVAELTQKISSLEYKVKGHSLIVEVGSSGILKGKQKLGVTFNFNKQDVIDFTKFSKMTMCRASEANS